MDAQSTVALFGLLGVIVTAVAGFFVAKMANTTEKRKATEIGVESTLRERLVLADDRLVLRDEQMQDLKNDLERVERERDVALESNVHLHEAVEARDMVIRELREELERTSGNQG